MLTGLCAASAAGLAPRVAAAQIYADPDMQAAEVNRFRSGRNLATAGGYVHLVGGGVGLAGILVAAGGATTAGTYLSYGGSGLGALGFFLEAGGLGIQHSAANNLGRDPGRGLFAAGTSLGVLGVAGIGTGIFIGASGYLRDAQGNDTTTRDVAILSCVGGGILLSTVAHILYAVDQHHLARAMSGVYVF